jgi:hypothetical protein
MIRLLAVAVLLCPSIASAWSEGGHHLIGLLAYLLLDDAEKVAFQDLLTHHPRFAEDFKVPGNVANADRWKAGWDTGRTLPGGSPRTTGKTGIGKRSFARGFAVLRHPAGRGEVSLLSRSGRFENNPLASGQTQV